MDEGKGPKTDYRKPMELLCELKGAHYDGINSIDVSPGMSMLVSSGNDSTASVYDLKQKRVIKKLTFRDNDCKDVRGNADLSNFGIRGCFFSPNGQFVYILASKAAYRSYLVKYQISSKMMGQYPVFSFEPVETVQVHNSSTSKMFLSRSGQLLAIGTSDGFIKLFAYNKYIHLLQGLYMYQVPGRFLQICSTHHPLLGALCV